MGKAVRNVAIIVALAVAFWQVPGGGTAGDTIANALSIAFFTLIAFFLARLYREHRMTLFGLGDRNRGILYGSAGLAVLALAATSRLWDEGGAGILMWFAMIGLAIYGAVFVYQAHRAY